MLPKHVNDAKYAENASLLIGWVVIHLCILIAILFSEFFVWLQGAYIANKKHNDSKGINTRKIEEYVSVLYMPIYRHQEPKHTLEEQHHGFKI